MPYYAVLSGNVFRCVVADDALSACVAAATLHITDDSCEQCEPGLIWEVSELGSGYGDNIILPTEHVQRAGGFEIHETQ